MNAHPGLLAEEILESTEYEDYTELCELLFEYLLYMNEPMSFTQLRKQCDAFGMIPVRVLKQALNDCTTFGNIETAKSGAATSYQIPAYLKPHSRALVVVRTA